MNKFLFELGTEEIPAAMIAPAREQLAGGFERLLREYGIGWDNLRTFSSPRRLALRIEGLPDGQSAREELTLGPPRSIGLDASGLPTQAAAGFARRLVSGALKHQGVLDAAYWHPEEWDPRFIALAESQGASIGLTDTDVWTWYRMVCEL